MAIVSKERICITRGFLLCLYVVASGAAMGQSATDDAAVLQYYPQGLIDEFPNRTKRDFSYIAVDLNGIGAKNYFIAAYSNGNNSAVAVLLKSATGVSLVSRPDIQGLTGGWPELESIDLDNDGKPEIVLSLTSPRGNSGQWLLKWNGATLQSIGPTRGGITLLYNSDQVDIDGDGRLEAITSTHYLGMQGLEDDPPPEGRGKIYRLESGIYTAVSGYTLLFSRFSRATGPPKTVSEKFTINAPAQNFRLRVVNGVFGNPRVASGTIRLNGVEVVSQNQLSQQVGYLTVPVTVQQNNTIEVTLGGTPLGSILVLVLPPE